SSPSVTRTVRHPAYPRLCLRIPLSSSELHKHTCFAVRLHAAHACRMMHPPCGSVLRCSHGYCVGLMAPASLAGVGRANEPCAAPSLARGYCLLPLRCGTVVARSVEEAHYAGRYRDVCDRLFY